MMTEAVRFQRPSKIMKGLNGDVVSAISAAKGEPDWMREFRLRSLEVFEEKPLPTWGADLRGVNFQELYYFARATDEKWDDWQNVPAELRRTYDDLGVRDAEQRYCGGLQAQNS